MLPKIIFNNLSLYQDGANINDMISAAKDPMVAGFTTNPTLMAKAGVTDYENFAKSAINAIPDKPISFEVFSDEFNEMEREAHIIKSWGGKTYVKIPVMNTKGESSLKLIKKLSAEGIPLNVTAIFSPKQIEDVSAVLQPGIDAIISIFAGRIADTGIDPMPIIKYAVELTKEIPEQLILWASPRELLNVFQADECGCQIITATPDILKKLSNVGKDLEIFSQETVQMFYNDASSAGFKL